MTRRARLWLCFPPVVLCLLDHALTIWGQPPWYWQSRFAFPAEEAPHGRWLLQQHPALFAGGSLIWCLAYAGAILLLPRRAALTVALALVIGHTWGSATWLVSWLTYRSSGYWLSLLLFLSSAALFVVALERSLGESP
ncbi:MAG: hypothetical protein IRY99_17445 [Isosphaeraceae bacterium]|nr:hypothetical protein [Isosphaeraceae bacterium]